MRDILYTLGKYKDKFDVASERIERMKIAEEFFQSECAEIIKKIESECGFNGKSAS